MTRDQYSKLLKEHGPRIAEMSIAYLGKQRTLGMKDNSIDVNACSEQIRHWMNVRKKDFVFENLNTEERFAVMDAIDVDPEIQQSRAV